MDIRVLYVNTDGGYEEHDEATDSIKVLSLKTASNELTDAKLAKLIDGSDAADEHIHDARYFRENEHITTSAGAADAGKPIKLDAGGKLDESFIDVSGLNALLDHGSLLGLGDDDHTQYLKTDGTRNLTGIQSYAVHPAFSADTQLVDKKYVDDLFAGSEWYNSVLDADVLTPPGSPVTGDRYLIDGVGAGGWAGKDNQIAEWNGSAWVYTVPTAGAHVSADDEPSITYIFNGAAWDAKEFESTTASNGLVKVGNDIRIDSGAAGSGLGFSSGVLSVNVDNSSIEINSDTLRVKALGIKDTMIDFGTGAGQVSAGDIPLLDAGGYFPTDTIEAGMQYLAGQIAEQGVVYTVGAGGVTKGDLVYVSGVNTVDKFTTLSSGDYCVGIALATVSAGGSVKVLANDTVVTGVLSSASPGDTYYWNGTALSATMPTGSGAYVWMCGVAKNATDLAIEVNRIKKNA